MTMARESFLDFALYVGRDKIGGSFSINSYMRLSCMLLQYCWENKIHYSHTAPFGLGKTTYGRLFCNYLLGKDPSMSQVVISGDLSISQNIVGMCRKTIVSKRYREIFPEVVPDALRNAQSALDKRTFGAHKFFLRLPGEEQSPDPAMDAVAAIPDAESRRTDYLYADDVMTRAIAASAPKRNSLCEAFLDTWIMGRCSNGGVSCVYQNCWHKEDLAHRLVKDERFLSAWVGTTVDRQNLRVLLWNAPNDLPLIQRPYDFDAHEVSPQGELGQDLEFYLPLPPMLSPEKLREKEEAPGDAYRKVFLMNASSKTDRMLPHFSARTLRKGTVAQMLNVKEMGGLPAFSDNDRSRFIFTGAFDISAGKRNGDAIVFLAGDAQRRIYPIEIHIGSFTTSEAAFIIDNAWRRGIRFGAFNVEDNATQKKIREEIGTICRQERRTYEWQGRILPFMTGSNKMDPTMGLPVIDVEIQTGVIIWPEGESSRKDYKHSSEWLQCETEMLNCLKDTNLQNTPDALMALWMARDAMSRLLLPGVVAKARAIEANPDRDNSARDSY